MFILCYVNFTSIFKGGGELYGTELIKQQTYNVYSRVPNTHKTCLILTTL